MKLDKSCALFFGTKIDSKLREGLALSKPGPAVTEVDDIQRNILSILRRVAPNARIPASAVKIFVLQGGAAIAQAVIDDEGEEGDEIEAGSSGPYITY